MARIVLLHWHGGEAEERAAGLRALGHEAFVISDNRGEISVELRQRLDSPPDAFLIDLSRIPSMGRAIGIWLRGRKAFRSVPLLFVSGEPGKVEQARAVLPDAVFTGWDGIGKALKKALASPPESPVSPGVMAPYSGTPLARKLNIRGDTVVALLGAPRGFERRIDGLPEGVKIIRSARGRARTCLLFVVSMRDLEKRFEGASLIVAEGGALWMIWPKQASGIASDLTQAKVRKFLMERHWVDYKIASIDETWTGMVFARRDNTAWLAARRRG